MNTKIIASMSLNSVGCTFLDWSILYLSGQDSFYSFKEQQFIPLIQNPITSINAHGHKKNHVAGHIRNKESIEKFLLSQQGLLTLYFAPLRLIEASEQLQIDIRSQEFATNTSKIKNHVLQDLSSFWNYLHSLKSKILWIADDPNLSILHLTPRHTEGKITDLNPTTLDDIDNDFQDIFYPGKKKFWADLNLTDVWDERERRALDLRINACEDINEENSIPFYLPHLHITTLEWWTQGESVIQQAMNFCELEIDQRRWEKWLNIYNQWQKTVHSRLSFYYRIPTILNAIVNNWYYDLGELSFEQEVAIQHYLIYKYNLNLKTWNLVKFPKNAQDLHKLLEPNIHPVQDIYNTK